MAGFNTGANEHLIRSNLWSSQIKEVLDDELFAMRYVDMITDFPDGDTINIPSIGQAEVNDYAEGQAIRYTAMDTGNFTFTINKYKSSATYITEKMKQDSFYMNRLVSSFVPKQSRAIAKAMEVDLLASAEAGQTDADANTINGIAHRYAATGTSDEVTLADFAKARVALQKANVPLTNLTAIIDPTVDYTLGTLTNTTNLLSPMPMWERVVQEGMSTGMQFRYNIYGFDCYVSQNLPTFSSTQLTVDNGVANLFFSAAPDVLPLVGNVRQPPKVDSEYNKDLQREEYVTTARYDFKLFRPENMVLVVSDTTVVS